MTPYPSSDYPGKQLLNEDEVIKTIGNGGRFHNIHFIREFSLSSDESVHDKLSFTNCVFDKKFSLSLMKFEQLTFRDCIFQDELYLGTIETIQADGSNAGWKGVEFSDCEINGPMPIDNCKINEFRFNSSKINHCYFRSSEVEFLKLAGSVFNRFAFEQAEEIDSAPGRSAIKHVQIGGALEDSNISFIDTVIEKISLLGIVNFGLLRFTNVNFHSPDASFLIKNSDIGNTFFSQIDFSRLKRFQVIRSNVSGIKTAGVIWPKEISGGKNVYIGGDRDGETLHFEQRDLYRQLKYAMESQCDRVQALEFQEREMRFLFKDLKMTDPDWWAVGFSQITSDHGRNWFKPFFQLVVASFLFFFPIMMLLGTSYTFDVPGYHFLSEWMHFMNPLQFDFITELVESGKHESRIALILFMLWKTVFFLWVYQIIAAFRKYSRKI